MKERNDLENRIKHIDEQIALLTDLKAQCLQKLQSVQTTSTGGERGSDGWKRVHGRQRHLLVDLMGLPLTVVVHAANIADCTGATVVLKKGNGVWTRLPWVWADGSDTGALIQWVKDPCGWVLELLTPRPGGRPGLCGQTAV